MLSHSQSHKESLKPKKDIRSVNISRPIVPEEPHSVAQSAAAIRLASPTNNFDEIILQSPSSPALYLEYGTPRPDGTFSPLSSYPSPEPSSEHQPQLPQPPPLNINKETKTESHRPGISDDGFEEVGLSAHDSRDSRSARPQSSVSEVPTTFSKQVHRHFDNGDFDETLRKGLDNRKFDNETSHHPAPAEATLNHAPKTSKLNRITTWLGVSPSSNPFSDTEKAPSSPMPQQQTFTPNNQIHPKATQKRSKRDKCATAQCCLVLLMTFFGLISITAVLFTGFEYMRGSDVQDRVASLQDKVDAMELKLVGLGTPPPKKAANISTKSTTRYVATPTSEPFTFYVGHTLTQIATGRETTLAATRTERLDKVEELRTDAMVKGGGRMATTRVRMNEAVQSPTHATALMGPRGEGAAEGPDQASITTVTVTSTFLRTSQEGVQS
ncbi:hypothetical protein FB567DRAFT_204546 [Paraphoma chrysanthemicola]|uniref:Uncharacterized protein n=1 Tax=Paraphoma chrysanthemicola TaxID=798071 RepID=A0A8K0QUY1_9PLEO|nr:hypothetical protein FB567DRAFT_204546 [Paraphoma chrysanthemicola]